jgi:hypothetical protein
MIRFVFVFVILSLLIHFGFLAWQKMSGSERWSLTKSAIYSTIIALIAVVAMMFIVLIF